MSKDNNELARKILESRVDILSEAASLFYYDDEELAEHFTPEEIADIKALKEILATKQGKNYTIGNDDAAYRMVAEDEPSYGE